LTSLITLRIHKVDLHSVYTLACTDCAQAESVKEKDIPTHHTKNDNSTFHKYLFIMNYIVK